MICPHCEKSKEVNCHCESPRSIASNDVPDDVRDLADDLTPLPIGNERLWAIIDDHLEKLRKRIRLFEQSTKHQDRVSEEYRTRLSNILRYVSERGNVHIDRNFLVDLANGRKRYEDTKESS